MTDSNYSGYMKVARTAGASEPADAAVVVKYAVIDASASGNNTIVAAVTGKKLRVISLFYLAAGTVTCTFQSGAGGTAITGPLPHTAQTGAVLNYNEDGWFETAAGSLLNLNLNAAIAVAGALSYIEV